MALSWLMAICRLVAVFGLMAVFWLIAVFGHVAIFRRDRKAALIPVDHSINHANMTSGSVTKLLIMGHCDEGDAVLIEPFQHINYLSART